MLRTDRIFIVGNGPSLRQTPLESIGASGCRSFGVNYIHKWYGQTTWRPSDFAMLDVNAMGERDYAGAVRFNHEAGAHCWVFEEMRSIVLRRMKTDVVPERLTFLDRCGKHRTVRQGPSSPPGLRPQTWHPWPLLCFWGGSVSGALQIAMDHYDAQEIVLVGCDLGFRAWDDQAHDPNHMVPNYVAWNAEHAQSIAPEEVNWILAWMHEAAAREAEQRGVKVWNATVGGELEAYERRPLESFVEEPATAGGR